MILHLQIIGSLSILLALSHVGFPGYFKWKDGLKDLSLINRQMMLVHTFFIALTVFLTGVLMIYNPEDLLNTRIGNQVLWGLGIFWGIRLLAQFFFYSAALWRGKKFETVIHILFAILWLYFTVALFWIAGTTL